MNPIRYDGPGAPPAVRRQPALPPSAYGDWPFTATPVADEHPGMPLWRECWNSIVRRRWLLAVAALVVTLAAVVVAWSTRPVYRSTATVLIEAGKAKILSIEEVYNAMSQDREYYQTQVEILRSRDVALRTVIATKLWNEPEFDPRRPDNGLSARLRRLVLKESPPEVWTPQMLANATVGRFQGAVTIEPVRLSQLVRVSFEAQDAALAARVANATAVSYIQADSEARSKLLVDVNGLLQERLAALREKLLQSEQALQAFREKEGLVNVGGQQGVAGQQMSEIGQRLVAARVRRTELESTFSQIQRAAGGDAGEAPAVLARAGIVEARGRVAVAQARLQDLQNVFGDQHAKVIEARSELQSAEQQLKAQTRVVVAAVRAELSAARETERSLEAALGTARGVVQGENRQEFQLGVLEREVSANRQLYEIFLNRTKETSVSTNLQGAVARVVDQAAPSTLPVRPNKSQIVGTALMLSLFLGALVSVLVDRLRGTVRDSGDAEQRFGRPVLASMPAVTVPAPGTLTRSVLDQPSSTLAEAIRAARTGILLSGLDLAHRVVMVTSTLPGEGRTTFCTNLALAHAQTKRTLLVECDLRHPQIAARLGLPADARGLADLVLGRAEVKDCLHAVPGSPLLVMPAGTVPPNPEELLLSSEFREVLHSLSHRVDVVVIDTPPVEAHSDALILAQQVNNTVYLVKTDETPHLRVHKGIERLQRAGASILGLVLNESGDREPRESGLAHLPAMLAEFSPLRRRAAHPGSA